MAKTLTDAYLVLLLAATIHGTDAAVRDTAKRCAKTLPRSKRDVMYRKGSMIPTFKADS
ncbi:DUF7740 domain-containing protein [Pseudomonas helleri]